MPKASEGEIIVVPVERVRPFEDQPRTFFEQNRLYRLSLSIKKLGQKHPVLLTPLDTDTGDTDDFDYEIVDGERRWRACQMGRYRNRPWHRSPDRQSGRTDTIANLAALASSLGEVLKRKEEFDASFGKTLSVG